MIPEDAAVGSSFEIIFKGNSKEKSKFTSAYVAMYYGKADEKLEVGDMLAKYDGKWKRMMPSNPTASQTANPYQFYQERETESKLF